MPDIVTDAPAGTSPAPDSAAEKPAQAAPVSEVPAASKTNGDPADQTPPASELDEFKADVAQAQGKEPTKPESETKADEAEPKTDEPGAEEKAEEADPEKALSQEEQAQVPEKLTDRPEWQALTKIGDKLGPAAGKEVRRVLRSMFKTQHDLQVNFEKTKPAQEVLTEMMQSVNGSEVGFRNMRRLITSFDSDPAGVVPMLETLLDDARKRAGLELQSPEFIEEAKKLDQQVSEGLMDKTAAEKRRGELLELEQARAKTSRVTQQSEQQRNREKAVELQKQNEAWVQETNQAEANWVAEKTKNDPDFAVVQDVWSAFAQTKALQFFNKNGKRPNAKESVQILEEAFKDAKAQAMKFRPKQKAIQPVTGGDGSSGKNRQQPRTEFEEFQAEVEAAKRRH